MANFEQRGHTVRALVRMKGQLASALLSTARRPRGSIDVTLINATASLERLHPDCRCAAAYRLRHNAGPAVRSLPEMAAGQTLQDYTLDVVTSILGAVLSIAGRVTASKTIIPPKG
ncbi:hypothetical protein CNE_2c20530 [Cupriavidus necator N-1]|uniref:Uncharacterized protein n=1 Tax=Cupriavidus necator (strain ATCC 43291 / DSM 13513 / CCUG 52238 / LMG 8453 / N-1) TaxID=1042878 RepID=F8GS63_CUPNN|nr:hypothetical protein CNE_2c20530 [Cupriavidus necator N-1]KAI3600143.1 hypothetical protein D8I24_4531 [Cupriavidus necator H850]